MQHVITQRRRSFTYRHFGFRSDFRSTACRAAADALEILSNLRPGFTRNVIHWMNSTAVSVSQPDNGDRQVNNEELQSNERAIQSLRSQASSISLQNKLSGRTSE